MNTAGDGEIMQPQNTLWKRALYMLLFAFLLNMAKFAVFTVVIVQFVLVLVSGAPNAQLLVLGQSLSTYTYQVTRFLTFNSEIHPYPLSDWPVE